MPEYRPLPEAYQRKFDETWSYAFTPESGPPEYDPEDVPPSARLGAKRGLFEDEELVAICRHYWFTCRIEEGWLPVGGVASVATLPEHRRQGHVRRLLSATLSEYREREIPLAALWPFDAAFYAQFGWALASRYARLAVPPEQLSFARDERDGKDTGASEGSFVRLEPDEYERLVPVLSAHGADQNLAMDRSEEWWRTRVFGARGSDPYVYGWERDGEIRAYVVYQVEDDGERELRAAETAWVDHEARLALLSFLADHDSQVDVVSLYASDAGLLDLVPSPGEVDVEVNAGAMVRLVDVARALRTRWYPDDASGSVVLDVDDPFADWNDARFELALEGGAATVERIEDGGEGPSAEPDASLDVGALSQLYVGYRSIADLARTGDAHLAGDGVDLLDDDEGRLLADAFSPADVVLREVF
jgi:predicted acetyltransferase